VNSDGIGNKRQLLSLAKALSANWNIQK